MAKPVLLVIRDGWGINPGGKHEREKNGDATLLARTPFHDQLYRDYPRSTLSASGSDVGLPEGQMGNSEVGHLNLGAGRIVYQDLTRINKAIAEGELARNDVLQDAFREGAQRAGFISSDSFPTAACIAIISICSLSPPPRRKPASSKFLSTPSPMAAMLRPPVERIT